MTTDDAAFAPGSRPAFEVVQEDLVLAEWGREQLVARKGRDPSRCLLIVRSWNLAGRHGPEEVAHYSIPLTRVQVMMLAAWMGK